MNVFLAHGNAEWVFSGFIVFFGLMVMLIKVAKGKIFDVTVGIAVWVFVYSIHGRSTAGIMSATLAALLFDLFGLATLKLFLRR